MRQSVSDAFFGFSQKLEGRISFMYININNLFTTDIGNLIDPIGAALPLPWADKSSGDPADAQLGLLSMSWALGPNFAPGFPSFRAACAAATAAASSGDLQGAATAWNQAADQSHIADAGNPGLVPRNRRSHPLHECGLGDPPGP